MTIDTSAGSLQGQLPNKKPPRVEDFDELDKRSIENLVDYMKYVATASGVTMGFYGNSVRDNLGSVPGQFGRFVVFLPVAFWLLAILFSVIGIFPRTYNATSDYDKERTVLAIRELKSKFARLAIGAFLLGFLTFAYVTAATLWKFYPFAVAR